MKAIICHKLGGPQLLKYQEIGSPSISPKEVKVQIKACSVNFPDTLIIQGKYQLKPELPFSPGSDIAGTIIEVGSEVKGFSTGDHIIGFIPYGGFAEEVAVHYKSIFPKPPQMDFDLASSFMLAYGTSYHALKDRAQLKAEETLVVLGASGGVGLAAVEIAKSIGARVIACASTDEKLGICREHGADEIINYNEEDLKSRIKELTDGKGADVIYDPVGGHYTEQALRACAWNGRLLVVGFTAGEIPKIPINLPLLKGCSIMGVFWGSFAQRNPSKNMQNSMELFQLLQNGKLKPRIDKRFKLEDAPKALSYMMDRKVKGKIVITMN